MNTIKPGPIPVSNSMGVVGQTSRIAAVDGLRAIAVLGVIWAHMWAFGFSAIPLHVGPLNINKLTSVIGTGVDLFFVISGYCMYLAYLGKPQSRSQGMTSFLKRRYLRIAPAYYASLILCVLFMGGIDFYSFFFHLVFLQYLVPQINEIATPYWSICTEMQFYAILPILVFVGERRLRLTVLILASLSYIFTLSIELTSIETIDFFHKQLPVRLVEFCIGILLAIILESRKIMSVPFWIVCLCSVVMILGGRMLMSSYFVDNSSLLVRLLGRSGLAVLASGYATLICAVVSYDSFLSRFLRIGIFQFLGKISYSMYLLHWFPCLWIARWFCSNWGATNFSLTFSFCLAVMLITIASYISYQLFEAPYFRLSHKRVVS